MVSLGPCHNGKQGDNSFHPSKASENSPAVTRGLTANSGPGSPVQEICNRLHKLLPGMKLSLLVSCVAKAQRSSKLHHPSCPNPRLPQAHSQHPVGKSFPCRQLGKCGGAEKKVSLEPTGSVSGSLLQSLCPEAQRAFPACPTHFQKHGGCKVTAQKCQGLART